MSDKDFVTDEQFQAIRAGLDEQDFMTVPKFKEGLPYTWTEDNEQDFMTVPKFKEGLPYTWTEDNGQVKCVVYKENRTIETWVTFDGRTWVRVGLEPAP